MIRLLTRHKKTNTSLSPQVAVWSSRAPHSRTTSFDEAALGEWYPPVMLGPAMIGELATSGDCLAKAMEIIGQLAPDDYVRYLSAYYRAGQNRFGASWRYADIVTALQACAQLVQPESYLEIGVRRGRSMAIVAATCPECEIVGFDMWVEDYAGMANPGAAFVKAEMLKIGHYGKLELIGGDSHQTIKAYFSSRPEAFFDLITVDGDHSASGAREDLLDVLPRLKIGGVLVFDDIAHPELPHLKDVWQALVVADTRFSAWQFDELGYGVAVAVRRT